MTTTKRRSQIALEANYTFQPAGGQPERIGVRLELLCTPISAKKNAFKNQADLRQAVADDAPLSLWVQGPANGAYTLVAVRPTGAKLLGALRLDRSQPVDPNSLPSGSSVPLAASLLAGPGLTVESVTVWLEAAGGARCPLPITAIGYAATAQDTKTKFADGSLAVLSTRSRQYRMLLCVVKPGFGPPGDQPVCKSLRASTNKYAQTVANWSDCPSNLSCQA